MKMSRKCTRMALLVGVATALTLTGFSVMGIGQSTCSVTAGTGAPDALFNANYTENGPGTGNEPSGAPGWTGADSTYSIQLPDGDTAFFFSDSYIGQSPTVSGDGTATSNANG